MLEYSGLLKDRSSRLFAIAGELCAVPGIAEHAIPAETVRVFLSLCVCVCMALGFIEEGLKRGPD